jgi:hypothetical protein
LSGWFRVESVEHEGFSLQKRPREAKKEQEMRKARQTPGANLFAIQLISEKLSALL